MAIGREGCLISIGIFTDDENDLISSSFRLVGFSCSKGATGGKLRFTGGVDDSTGERVPRMKSDNENVCKF